MNAEKTIVLAAFEKQLDAGSRAWLENQWGRLSLSGRLHGREVSMIFGDAFVHNFAVFSDDVQFQTVSDVLAAVVASPEEHVAVDSADWLNLRDLRRNHSIIRVGKPDETTMVNSIGINTLSSL